VSDSTARTVCVTGATGFIGGAVVRRLVSSGWKVRVLIRPSTDSGLLLGPSVNPVTGSLEDVASLHRLLDGVQAVIHCAGVVRGVTKAQFNSVNVDGVGRLAKAAIAQQTPPRFLLLSSLAARQPGLSPYAASKRQGEDSLASFGRGLQWTVFRPPAVYGPGDRELLPLFRLMARGMAPRFGTPSARFSLLFIEDLAQAVLSWLETDNGLRQVIELHDGREKGYSWSDVADVFESLTGRRVLQIPIPALVLRIPATLNWLAGGLFRYAPMLTPGKVRELTYPQWVCDNDAVTHAIGWVPKISLTEGLRRTLDRGQISNLSP